MKYIFYKIATILFLIFFFSLLAIGQGKKPNARVADKHFASGSYKLALEAYQELLNEEPDNLAYNYNAGMCYLNINANRANAIPYLQKVANAEIEKALGQEKLNSEVFYQLGRAYHYGLKFDEAIQMFNKYKEMGGGKVAEQEIDKQIEFCENAKEITKFKVDVSFENLGSNVNSPYPDYFPFVPLDESFIVYNSRRDDGSILMNSDVYSANVYMSNVVEGVYSLASRLGKDINTSEGTEEVIGLSANGSIMLLYYDNVDGFGDLYITTKKGNDYAIPNRLGESINTTSREVAACITKDGNTLYFASDREGGYGGTDIYVVKKLPTGDWALPLNLGSEINTPYDDDFPNISPDEETLYFSSKGHTSMGGYDIFKAKWNADSSRFEHARNIGYPINTPYDDMNFRVSETGRYGYIAAVRPEGFGDYDIYRVTFNEIETKNTVIKGIISSADSTLSVDDVMISVTDINTGDVYGDYLPNPLTMRYIIILPPGEFNILFDVVGFKTVSEDVKMLDKSSFEAEIVRDVVLQPE